MASSLTGANRLYPSRRTVVFVDGENLCARYEQMVSEGRKPTATVLHERGSYVWLTGFIFKWPLDVLRVNYYMAVSGGDAVEFSKLLDRMRKLDWNRSDRYQGHPVPRVFKKSKSGEMTKSVDVNICVDVLRHCYSDQVDSIMLMSGDGDYLPLLREVMKIGKQTFVAAFSRGLNSEIPQAVDGFELLDDSFFFA